MQVQVLLQGEGARWPASLQVRMLRPHLDGGAAGQDP